MYFQNRLVIEGDMTGPFSANIVLSNPTVDVAVLETARGGILLRGDFGATARLARGEQRQRQGEHDRRQQAEPHQ